MQHGTGSMDSKSSERLIRLTLQMP
jgi:hypothetical protein